MVDEPALNNINELVVAAWVGWQHEESRINEIADGVVYDSLHDFAIAELAPHPYTVDDGRAGMEIEMIANRVSIKAVYIKDCLDVLDRDVLNHIRFEEANAEVFKRALGRIPQEFFDRVPSRGFQVAFDGPGAELDHDLFRLGCVCFNHQSSIFLASPQLAIRQSSANVSL